MGESRTKEPIAVSDDLFGAAGDALRGQAALIARVAAALSPGNGALASAGAHVAEFADHLRDAPPKPRVSLAEVETSESTDRARRMRIVESLCIEAIRHTFPEDESKEIVSRLREGARDIIPNAAVSPEDFRFFEQFIELGDDAVPGDHARTNAFVHTLMNGLDEMVYVHDMQGAMLFVNKRAMALTGFNRDDYYSGISIYDIVAPESLRVVEERLQSPHHAPWSSATINVLSKSGERVGIDFHTRPFIENGSLTAIVGMGHEIAVTGAQPRFLPVGFMVLDGEGRLIEASNDLVSRMGCGTRDELLGRTIPEFATQVSGEVGIESVIAEVADFRVEISTGARIGRTTRWELSGARHEDEDGDAIWFVSANAAVSRASGEPSENMLSSVLTVAKGVAHELNNPLTGIWGQAQRLLELTSDEEQRKRIEQIVHEAGRCRRIMEGLLGFARAESQGFGRTDLAAIVNNVSQMLRYQIEADDVEFNVENCEAEVEIEGDVEALRSVIRHLVHNAHLAARDTPEGKTPRVLVRMEVGSDEVVLTVLDTGPGVPTEIQRHVFTPFYTTRPLGEGMGMGLSICYGIIAEHKGTISVRNTNHDGAVFTIHLPLAKS